MGLLFLIRQVTINLTLSGIMTSLARHWLFMSYHTMKSYTRHATKVTVEFDN